MSNRAEEMVRAKQLTKSNYMEFQMALMKLPKIDLYADNAAELLKDHLQKYIEICTEHGQLPSQANYALSLHMSRTELQRYLRGGSSVSDNVYNQLHEANNLLGAVLEDNMLSGTSHVVGSIFVAKNNFGYKDQSEQIIVHQHQALSAEELKQIASNLPDVIDVDYTEVREQIEEKSDEEDKIH